MFKALYSYSVFMLFPTLIQKKTLILKIIYNIVTATVIVKKTSSIDKYYGFYHIRKFILFRQQMKQFRFELPFFLYHYYLTIYINNFHVIDQISSCFHLVLPHFNFIVVACQRVSKIQGKENTKKRRENMLLFEEAKAIKKRKTSSKYV